MSRTVPSAMPYALVGPTASGKSDAAVPIAEALGAEIVSVDSMLVYRGMDVGTAKPSSDLRRRVPHHLIDVADPLEAFSVAEFQSLARKAVAGIEAGGSSTLLVGGTGLYFHAVVDGLRFPRTEARTRSLLETEARAIGTEALYVRLASFDAEAASRMEPTNSRRVVRALEVAAVTGRPFSSYYRNWGQHPEGGVVAAGVELPRAVLGRRIESRVEAMLPGLLEETRRLAARGFGRFLTATQAIGYAEAVACLDGEISVDEAAARTIRRTKALARRQMAWFRRDPRIRWFEGDWAGAAGLVDQIMDHFRRSDRSAGRPRAVDPVRAASVAEA